MVDFQKLLDKEKYLQLRRILDQDIGESPFCIETYGENFLCYDGRGSVLVISR